MIATTRTVSLKRLLAAAALAVAAAMLLPSLPGARAAFAAPAPADKAAASPTAEQIVDNYIAARGGLKKIKGIQSLRMKAYVNAGAGRDGVAVRELKKPGKIRFEFTVQGKTAVYLSNGKQGWQVSTLEGDLTPKELPEDVLMDATEQADIEGPLVDWKSKGHRLELVGRETIDGIDAYKLKVDLKSGGSRTEYIDAKTWYDVRSDSTRKSRTGTVKLQTKFSDFKKTSGIVFPRKVEVQAENRPNKLRLELDQVDVNPSLPDARFELSPSSKK